MNSPLPSTNRRALALAPAHAPTRATSALPLAFALALVLGLGAGCSVSGGRGALSLYESRTSESQWEFRHNDRPLFTYNLRPPAQSTLPVDAGGYFHPLFTPKGVVATDFSPADHRHHRGAFLAWVELHGALDADFWGWGAHAPIAGRRIVNRSITDIPTGFRALNDWVADGKVVIAEELEARTSEPDGTHVLDLTYRLTPQADTTLARWAFSGFCVRVRKDGDIRFLSPAGESTRPNPVHTDPASDWPDAPWYAAEQRLPDGTRFGSAVLNHPGNPATLWHNHRDIRMINPCIVAPAAVQLTAGKPLVLRYRVVTFDGPAPVATLNRLAAQW